MKNNCFPDINHMKMNKTDRIMLKKYRRWNMAFPLLLVFLGACNTDQKVVLFNGGNLDNWIVYTEDPETDPSQLFRAEDGVIRVAGTPSGYLRTRESYGDYELHLEWRWTGEPVNSGVLLHLQGEEMIWPNSIECQLKHRQAGDVVLIGEGAGITVGDSVYLVEPEQSRFVVIPRTEESSENPPGQWNSYDIRSLDGNLEVRVNGVLQNRGSGMTLREGKIALQSEGAPMEFRNIFLVRLSN